MIIHNIKRYLLFNLQWLIALNVLITFPHSSSADTLYAIIAGDTRTDIMGAANEIAPSVEKDLANLQSFIKRISTFTHLKMSPENIHLLRGKEAGKALTATHLKTRLNNLKVTPKDVVIFYYSGHGFRPKGKSSPWPYISLAGDYLEQEAVSLDDVVKILQDKKPRFFIALADACNTLEEKINGDDLTHLSAREDLPTYKQIKQYRQFYQKLFENSSGYLIASSSIQNQNAYGDQNKGGLFTTAFLTHFYAQAENSSVPSWHTVMEKASQVIYAIDKQGQIHTQLPQYQINLQNYTWDTQANEQDKLIAYFPNYGTDKNSGFPYKGLIAYYPFSGNAHDDNIHQYHGTVVKATLTTDRFGKANSAYLFDGKQSYIKIPHHDSLNLKGDFTISFWVERHSKPTLQNVQSVISKGSDGQNSYLFRDAGGSFALSDETGKTDLIFAELLIKKWYFIAITIDQRTKKLSYYYAPFGEKKLNMKEKTLSHEYQISNDYPLVIGRHFGNKEGTRGPVAHYDGKVDDILIYQRALSSLEIESLWQTANTSRGPETPEEQDKLCFETQESGCGEDCLEFCGKDCDRSCD
jgi:hypothetical protein